MPDPARLATPLPLLLAALVAVAGPALLAWNAPPSSTFLNQALAMAGWCLVTMVLARWLPSRDLLYRGGLGLVWWALGLVMLAALLSPVWAGLPWGLSLSATGVLLVTGLVASAGAAVSQSRRSAVVFRALAWALVVAGVGSGAVAAIQLFEPAWADGAWIARSTVDGRAVGNLRQANHLATLLLWSAVALAWLADMRWRRSGTDQAYAPTELDTRAHHRQAAPRVWWPSAKQTTVWSIRLLALAAMALFMAGVVFSGSRTGLLGTLVLAAWGGIDRRLAKGTRVLLVAAPVLAAVAWWAMSTGTVGGATSSAGAAATALAGQSLVRAGSDISSSRFAIWSNTLQLIAQNPWLGVGFGEFNFAWTLTPFPNRPIAFFDHTHNLPLQLLVELGIPLGLVVMGFLCWALWRAWRQVRRHDGEHGLAIRAAFVMVMLMVLHSQLEYPLWYAHFLLPTAFALGLCIAGNERRSVALRAEDATRTQPVRTMLMAGLLGLVGTGAAAWDYQRVVEVFKPSPGAPPLDQRIAEGRQSWFFAHHADYAVVTTAPRPSTYMPAFDRAAHHLLDVRLMRAWAQALDETNQVDRSRHMAQRLAEFRNPQAADFFAVCAQPVTLKPAGAGSPLASETASSTLAAASGTTAASDIASMAATPNGASVVNSRSMTAASVPTVNGAPRPASWVEMAASFPLPVPLAALPKGPAPPPPDPAFSTPTVSAVPFQCLKPNRVLGFQDFR